MVIWVGRDGEGFSVFVLALSVYTLGTIRDTDRVREVGKDAGDFLTIRPLDVCKFVAVYSVWEKGGWGGGGGGADRERKDG